MPWNLIGTVLLGIVKWVFEQKAAKKLSQAEFIAYISAHQENRQNTGVSSQDFDKQIEEARAKLKIQQGK